MLLNCLPQDLGGALRAEGNGCRRERYGSNGGGGISTCACNTTAANCELAPRPITSEQESRFHSMQPPAPGEAWEPHSFDSVCSLAPRQTLRAAAEESLRLHSLCVLMCLTRLSWQGGRVSCCFLVCSEKKNF